MPGLKLVLGVILFVGMLTAAAKVEVEQTPNQPSSNFSQSSGDVVLTPFQMFAASSILAALAGGTTAFAETFPEIRVLLYVTIRTGVLGAGLSMLAYQFVAESPVRTYAVIGGCGLIGLGGLESVTWATTLLKRWASKRYARPPE